MIELQGKYNTAKVFTNNIDSETISQIINLLNQEFIKKSQIRIMPDCHAGAGCVIGTTMTIQDKVVPNLVGSDIGCGMLAIKLDEKEIDLPKLDKVINNFVPSGFNVHENMLCKSNVNKILAPVDIDLAYKSLGTLGGGNHFIEVNKDNDDYYLVIHSGSRHLGTEVAKYYQELGYNQINSIDIKNKINDTIQKLKEAHKEKEIENTINFIKSNSPHITKDLCYIEGNNFDYYIHDIHYVQEHAKLNRKCIAEIIIKHMNWHIKDTIETIHNYIDLDNMILRKGSVSAKKGEKLIIPINMKDGSLICEGKGNPEWNYSAPHGAGRILSRSKAKDILQMQEYIETMEGIYTTSVTQNTIDESPMAYKPMREIIENIKDTANIIKIIKPIYNFKAH